MCSTFPVVVQPFGKVPINKALGSEYDSSALYIRLQNIANRYMYLFTDVLRNHYLELGFYGDNFHGLPFQFNC